MDGWSDVTGFIEALLSLFFRDGHINPIGFIIVLAVVIALISFKLVQLLKRKQVQQKASPLNRNDVIVRCREIKQVAFFDGRDLHQSRDTKQSYWLSSSYVKDYANAYVGFSYKGKPIKIGILSKDVKTIKLCLGDSPKDTNYFDKLELTQLARYFGFELRRDDKANLSAKHHGNSLTLSVKRAQGMIFFFIYSIVGSKTSKGAYLFGVYEVVPTQRLLSKYDWLRE